MKFKVLFIQANPPMDTMISPSVAILSSCLKKKGFDVKLFDTTFYRTKRQLGDKAREKTLQVKKTKLSDYGIHFKKSNMIDDFKKFVKKYKPNLLCFSCVEATYDIALKLAKCVNNIPKVIGGIYATTNPEGAIKDFDIVCIGEGDKALVELCKRLRDLKDITKIKNLWVKSVFINPLARVIFRNAVRPPTPMNELPFQDLSIFDEKRLWKPMNGKIRKTVCILLNVGCPYSCAYCCNHFMHKLYNHKYYREQSIKRFIEEAKHYKEKYGIEFLYINAESFLTTSQKRFDEFIERYNKEIRIPFWIEARPESITEDKAKKLEKYCESMSIGIESGDEEFRRKILNRHMTNEQIINSFKILKKYDIRVCVNNIIGFPKETRKNIFKTIELNRKIKADNVMIHIFNPYYGTVLRDVCVSEGYIPQKYMAGDYRFEAVLDMPELSRKEILGLQRTFAMYVKLPKSRWEEIKKAETDDNVFENLSEEYRRRFL